MASTEPVSAVTAQPRYPSEVWMLAPCPVIVADVAGVVLDANPAAFRLMPGVVPGANLADAVPAWLARAHQDVVARIPRPSREGPDAVAGLVPVSGRIAEQGFEAHPTPSADGRVVWWLIDDTERRLAEGELATERERTRFLAEASNVLLASLNTDRCLAATAQLAADFLADAVAVVTPPRGGKLSLAHAVSGRKVTHHLVTAEPAQLPGLSEALQGFPPVPSRWIDPEALPEWVRPDGFDGRIGSVVVTPLPGHGVPAGALILLRSSDQAQFSESEEVFARLFAARAGAALSAARLYTEQSAISRTLMRDLLPPRLERRNGVDFAGGYRPAGATERVGGDFYDVHPGSTQNDASLVVLGDVCGKGLDAAVLTGKIRNTLQALTPMADDHERMLQLLNDALLNSHHTRFATLVLASVQRIGHQVRLRLTAAGHPAPLVIRGDGSVETADTYGTLIGALSTIQTRSVDTVLQPGDTCVLYTDGFTEARGGPLGDELFGEQRFEQALSTCAGIPAEAVVERLQMLASQWLRDGSHDDMAVVAISAPRTTHLSAVNGHTRGRYTA